MALGISPEALEGRTLQQSAKSWLNCYENFNAVDCMCTSTVCAAARFVPPQAAGGKTLRTSKAVKDTA